jgi:antirestriction protein ArdC
MDIYQAVTDQIVAALENARRWEKPWISAFAPADGAGIVRPISAASGKPYRGINVPVLWAAGRSSPEWATYKAWSAKGAQVRKGERGTMIVFWKRIDQAAPEGEEEAGRRGYLMAKGYTVFNAEQVDGYSAPVAVPGPVVAPAETFQPIAELDGFIGRTGAVIRHGGDRAYFTTAGDFIQMPHPSQFKGSSSSSAAETYYGTLLHELTHWTGTKARCDRQFGARFGDKAYAFEELVAELGSAFMSCDQGLTPTPRQDHANYLASWLETLKGDKRAIFTAASKAEAAVRFIAGVAAAEEDAIAA